MNFTSAKRATARVPGALPAGRAARLARSASVIMSAGVFDQAWYETQSRRTFTSARAAVLHYVWRGRLAGLSPHPLFEPSAWDPLRWQGRSGDPLSLYLFTPRATKRRPHPVWDHEEYERRFPAAKRHRFGVLGHFVEHAEPTTAVTLTFGHEHDSWSVDVPWSVLRDHLFEKAAAWAEQENLKAPPRWSDTWDAGAERTFVQSLPSAAPQPEPATDAPVVSVVMPAWNRASQVRRAVMSLQRQTMRSWELLIVDDGSTDDTAQVAEGLAAFDPRIRVLREPHRGVSAARNTAITHARGRWIAFLDTDNVWRPRFLELSVRALEASEDQASFAAMRASTVKGDRYRSYDGGEQALLVGNHIDLNVLVVAASLVRDVGGFSEDLRRAVDYDLVLRVASRTSIRYLPFVGADYADTQEDENRISVREPLTWDHAVRARHLVDWPALHRAWQPGPNEPAPNEPGPTGDDPPATGARAGITAVVPTTGDLGCTGRTVGALRADVQEIVVADPGSDRWTSLATSLLELADRTTRVVRTAAPVGVPLSVDVALPHVSHDVTLLCQAGIVPDPGTVPALCARLLADDAHRAVQPVLLGVDGAVEAAGVDLVGAACTPLPLFVGHPREDVDGLGPLRVPGLSGEVVAVRTRELVAVEGIDARLAGRLAWTDLSMRLSRGVGSALVVDTEAVARRVARRGEPALAATDPVVFRTRWFGSHRSPDHSLWNRAGFELEHVRSTRSDAAERSRIPELPAPTMTAPISSPLLSPVLSRPARTVAQGPGAGRPSLRWALRIAAPAGRRGESWGDKHFAEALAASLRRLGQDVAVHAREAGALPSAYLDDVELVIRGLDFVVPDPAKISLLWVISHPDRVTPQEVAVYDGAFAASRSWSRTMTEQGDVRVQPLLQCTDPSRFHPGVAAPVSEPPILFIGNSRNIYRPVVRHVVEADLPLTVIGSNWEQFLPPGVLVGKFLPNEAVAAAYRQAGVVLNDHWEDMRAEGFCSNRLFDVAAVGGRALSDPVDGVDDLFGGSVRTWTDPPSLVELLTAPVEEVFPSEEQRREVAAVVAAEHSFDRRAEQLLDAAQELWEAR